MDRILSADEHRVFTLTEAQRMVPILLKLTQMSQAKVNELVNKREACQLANPDLVDSVESQISSEVDKWHNKLRKLGIIPKGIWLADFDNGDGYYCWKYPEIRIKYFHGYQDGFTGRKVLQ